ncbi:flagellar biosynthesis protein FlhA [Clostridium sp. C105KSO13]|uniref:flagellar biosynthesis protein FlhA n=1 Tax=Clostridium sp. C105KSO13 TaxID=1776045 RepID=UPI0007407F2F|nr:flagellar biosynthesis protein FlhA [Clostridium sp. C105KSO13]CUX49425.1 Flagellar biosynthesis protein FlhA [Clostridium sp. C105KSO13]
MKRLLNNSVALFVVVIVLLLIIPMPPFVLDVMIIINISLSMIILLISMNIKEPLEFSIFPSLLLITTLFRLGINVSSTRNILTRQGEAGQVIHSFGSFVLQGNIVVGFIIFFIIVLVQFIVITKGAERVAEVAARFTLDAMPGKQMAIDADLSSGLINEQEARMRRNKIQREADFYGAMDGATKIVKGDAIMALIITAINLIGGFAIGILMSGLELSQALSVYSIATVGDGLVSQIPALLISTSTGMIVTRAVSEGSLNEDVSKQFLAQPRAIMMTGAVLLILMLVPGMPKIQMGILAAVFIIGGHKLSQKVEENAVLEQQAKVQEAELSAPPVTEEEYFKDINNIYSLIEVEPIEMEFGYSLIPLIDESSGGKMINRIVIFRRQYAQDMGFVIPSVRLRDSSALNTNQYVIKIRGEEVARGEILVDHYLALEPPNPSGTIDGIETIEPAYGIPSKWILPENKEMAEIYGYTVIDPLSVMITHLSETIKQHAYELLNRQETNQLLETVKKTVPELVEEVIPGLMTLGNFQKILVNLLKEGIPIKGMETILETIANTSVPGEDTTKITEKIRVSLKRTITRRFCVGGQLRVVTLDAELEKNLVQCLTRGEQGTYLAVSPDIMQSILTQVGEEIKKFQEISQDVIILTSQVIRVYLYQMLEQFYPSVNILAFNEIADNVQIQAIGNIRQE